MLEFSNRCPPTNRRGWRDPVKRAGTNQSALRTRIAATGSGSVCVRIEKLTAFLELESAILQPRKRQSRLH
jgi:hypothetical protein